MTSAQFGDTDEELVEDALAALDDVTSWRLTEARWVTVAQIIATLAAALERGDAEEFRAATIELELVSPTRITRIGEEPKVPPPPPVREITNVLVRSLVLDDADRADAGAERSDERRAD
jgi:hypothetical protein